MNETQQQLIFILIVFEIGLHLAEIWFDFMQHVHFYGLDW
jgi:hypothetical protein